MIRTIKRDLIVLKWMAGINLVLIMAILCGCTMMRRVFRLWLGMLALILALLGVVLLTIAPGWLLERYTDLPAWDRRGDGGRLVVSLLPAWFMVAAWQ